MKGAALVGNLDNAKSSNVEGFSKPNQQSRSA